MPPLVGVYASYLWRLRAQWHQLEYGADHDACLAAGTGNKILLCTVIYFCTLGWLCVLYLLCGLYAGITEPVPASLLGVAGVRCPRRHCGLCGQCFLSPCHSKLLPFRSAWRSSAALAVSSLPAKDFITCFRTHHEHGMRANNPSIQVNLAQFAGWSGDVYRVILPAECMVYQVP